MAVLTRLRRRQEFVPPPGSYLLGVGEQRHVGRVQRLWLTPALARAHVLIIGQTGSGKTKFIEALCRQFMERGQGFALLDLHGDLATTLRAYVATLPAELRSSVLERLLWVDVADPGQVVTFNPLAASSEQEAATQRLELLAAFQRHWSDFWGPRLADLMSHSLAVLQPHKLTLAEIPLLLGDRQVRAELVADRRVPVTARDYFTYRFDALSRRDQVLISESTMNKVSALMSDYRVRTFLGAPKGTLRPKEAIASGRIVLCRVPRGELVENANLVASLLLAAFHTAALSRASVPPAARRPYTLVLDEAQIASETFPQLLSGARAFGLSAIAGVQYLQQLPRGLAEALLANCRVRVCFALSRTDAERMARELFRADGDHVKYVDTDLLGSKRSRPTYWSVPEEFEYAIRELQDQETGEYVAQLGRRLPWYAETASLPDPQPNQGELALVTRTLARKATSRRDVEAELSARRAALANKPLTTKGGAHAEDPDDAIEPLT